MASIFKSLPSTDISVVPFTAYYKFSYVYQSGSVSNPSEVTIAYGEKYTSTGVRLPNSTYELFDFISQSFYSAIPYAAYGTNNNSYIPSASVYVINITQNAFGEKVLPGSFSITVGTSQSYDDGKGNLIVSSSNTGSIVGRIFYDKGIALFKPTSSISGGGLTNKGLYIVNGTSVNVRFSSSVLLYENTYKVKVPPTDFLVALNNPTVTTQLSASTQTPIKLMSSQSMLPYVTTIGLYNKENELLMVAKPSVPIQRTKDVIQTFIVRFDV
jgi:hypothetical protein